MDPPTDTDGAGSDSPSARPEPETISLFEDSWFFGNLFDQRPPRRTMSRCFSDPCTSSSSTFSSQQQEVLSSNGSAETSPKGGESDRKNMEEGNSRSLTRQRSCKGAVNGGQCSSSRRNLVRTPSLPASVLGSGDGEDDDDDETDVRMSNLIRKAFAQSSKGIVQNSGTSRSNRPPRSTEHESSQTVGAKEVTSSTRRSANPKTLMKSISNLETQLSRSSRGPGFELDRVGLINRDAVSSKASSSSCMREKKRAEDFRRPPQMSDEWAVRSSEAPFPAAPAVPRLVRTDSAEDMKAHIKLWARNVATNVRQEC